MKILVTGASAGVGLELTEQLAADGHDVRAMSRRPRSREVPDGVEEFVGDPTDGASLRRALAGVDGVFLNSVFLDGADSAGKAARAVHEASVPRIALLSSISAFTRAELAYAARFRAAVDALRSLNPRTTSLHPGQFASNVLTWREMVGKGTVVQPFGDVRLPVVDPYDIAAVAKVALTRDGHEGASLRITGADSPSPREKAAAIADATGRRVEFVEASVAQARADLGRFLSPDLLDYYIAVNGYPTPPETEVLPTVEDLTGSRPRSFRTWLENHVDAFL